MEERLCSECKKPLPDPPYKCAYCPVCRFLYGVERRSDLVSDHFPRGRDRLNERLREGFHMMDDDDSSNP